MRKVAVVTTGFFDGVHLGHRHVLSAVVSSARERGEEAVVVTFWPHPRTVLQQDAREFRILTSLEEKKALLLGDIPYFYCFLEERGLQSGDGGEFSDFVAKALIPYVQQHYNVYTDALHSSIAGRSLGGLEAFYIAMENPDKIGTAGALSPSFWVFADDQWNDYLSKKTFDKNLPFLYFYTGNEEDDTGKETKEMVERIKKINYPVDKYVLHYNENGGHAFPYWKAVLSEFLEAMVLQDVEVL